MPMSLSFEVLTWLNCFAVTITGLEAVVADEGRCLGFKTAVEVFLGTKALFAAEGAVEVGGLLLVADFIFELFI